MSQVLQSDMDALAQAANDVLLPVINGGAVSTSANFQCNVFDVVAGRYLIGYSAISPQPAYGFLNNTFTNLVSGSSVFNGSGQYVYTISTTGFYHILIGPGESFFTTDESAGYTGVYSINFYDLMTPRSNRIYLTSGKQITITGTVGASVKSKISVYSSWLFEINRIKGDLMAVLTGGLNTGGDDTAPTGDIGSYGAWSSPTLAFGTPLYMNPQAVCSGPWIVYINDPSTYDLGKYLGILYGAFDKSRADANYFQCFQNVAFYTTDNTVKIQSCLGDGITLSSSPIAWDTTSSVVGPNTNYTSTVKFNPSVSGTIQGSITFGVTSSVFPSFATSFGSVSIVSNGGTSYTVTISFAQSLVAGDNVLTLNYQNASAGGFYAAMQFTYDTSAAGTPYSNIIHPTNPGYKVQSSGMATPTFKIYSSTSAVYFSPCWILTNPAAFGLWEANTLPIPAQNVFLDQDIYNYKNLPANNFNYGVQILENGPAYDSSGNYVFKKLIPGRQYYYQRSNYGLTYPVDYTLINGTQTLTDDGYFTAQGSSATLTGLIGHTVEAYIFFTDYYQMGIGPSSAESDLDSGGVIQPVAPSVTPKPTKWPIKRSTDFLPFQHSAYVGDAGDQIMIQSDYSILNPSWGTLWHTLGIHGQARGSNGTIIAVRAAGMSINDVGWLNGVNQIGYPHATKTFHVYVSLTNGINPFDPTTYDFVITGADVTIPGNAPYGYDARVFANRNQFYYMVVTTDNTYTTLSTYSGAVPHLNPKYFFWQYDNASDNTEIYSYCLNGESLMFLQKEISATAGTGQKIIPQSGYCIFKVKASRLPVDIGRGIQITPLIGSDLTITLGQWVTDNSDPSNVYFEPLKADGGLDNLTIEIPATASDSGEVVVYLPVLGGNELVYQCSQQIILEAWVNWQPIWFSNVFGSFDISAFVNGSFTTDSLVPQPLAFQHCLAFVNFSWSATPQATYVQYPLARCVFDDIVSLLRIINPNYNYPQIGAGNSSWFSNTL